MDPLVAVYDQQRGNVKSLKRRLRFPNGHGLNLPPSVDLRKWMTEIKDQGAMGSCVANAIVSSIEYLYLRYTGRYTRFSRLFIDYNARCVHNNRPPHQQQRYETNGNNDPADSFGTNREDGLRAVQMYGFCEESLWPYSEDLFQKCPPQKVYDEAARRSIVPLRIPVNVISVKTCLAHQIPVLVGIQLSDDDNGNYRGRVHIPQSIPKDSDFHACLIVGYDDRTQHFILRNSWGTDWGDQGYGYLPYQYLIHRQLVVTDSAFWAIVQLIPRGAMPTGFFSYPYYTQYHLQHMLPPTISTYQQLQKQKQQQQQQQQQQQHRFQRKKWYH